MNYYNENDPALTPWLYQLMAAGAIAPGHVDTRSIEDVAPYDLREFSQCHFFAGIGGWAYALRLAGWPDDRPVWTGSCPCQPFSAAGKGAGFADERHLWPAWHWLLAQCRPGVIFGEQVASKDGLAWLDLVLDDLEVEGYAAGAFDICAAGVGAPHIRQRLWFLADALPAGRAERGSGAGGGSPAWGGRAGSLADSSSSAGLEGRDGRTLGLERAATERGGGAGTLADADRQRRVGLDALLRQGASGRDEADVPEAAGHVAHQPERPGFWSTVDWIACRDGKARPVEPGTFPLAHGLPARVGRLRGYGNAIVPQVAAEVIGACLEHEAIHQAARR